MKVIVFVCGFLVWTAGLGGLSGCAASRSDAPFEVIANIKTGDNPHGIWFDRTRNLAYVACSGADQIDVIDCRTLKVIDSLPAGNVPLDVVASADERYLIATQFRDGELIKFRRTGGPVEKRWKVGEGGSLFSPRVTGDLAYLVCEFADRLVVFDRRAMEITASYETGDQPYPAAVTKDGRLAFVPNKGDNSVTVIDLTIGQTIATIAVGEQPQGGALTRDDRYYIVAESEQDSVAFIDAITHEVVARITEGVGRRPFAVAVTLDDAYGIINNAGGSTVSILDIAREKIIGEIETGDQPIVVRMHPDGKRIFISNEVSGTVTVLKQRQN